MRKPLTALVAAGALGLAMVSTTQPARAMDPWTAAAWFVGGMFVAGIIGAPLYRANYAYAAPVAYAGPVPYATPAYSFAGLNNCYWTRIQRGGVWRNARVCY